MSQKFKILGVRNVPRVGQTALNFLEVETVVKFGIMLFDSQLPYIPAYEQAIGQQAYLDGTWDIYKGSLSFRIGSNPAPEVVTVSPVISVMDGKQVDMSTGEILPPKETKPATVAPFMDPKDRKSAVS